MTERAAYSRVYWSIMDDPKFDGIRSDVRHLGSWSLLLIVADMAWPAPAFVPPSVPRSSYRALVEAGIVDDLSGGLFRIHGLAAERGRRRDAATRQGTARAPTGTQLGPKRDPNGEQDETRRGETSQDEQNARDEERWDAPETEALQWLARHGCDVRGGFRQQLITAIEVHGSDAMIGMFDRLAAGGTKQGDIRGFLFPAIDALNAKTRPDLRSLERDEAAQERTAVRNRRIQEGMWARRIERFQQTGQWEPEWGKPPSKVTA